MSLRENSVNLRGNQVFLQETSVWIQKDVMVILIFQNDFVHCGLGDSVILRFDFSSYLDGISGCRWCGSWTVSW